MMGPKRDRRRGLKRSAEVLWVLSSVSLSRRDGGGGIKEGQKGTCDC